MSLNASHALGADELAGTIVTPKGSYKRKTVARTAGGVLGGVVGSIAAEAAMGQGREAEHGAPSFAGAAYLAVTAAEVALVQTKTGFLKPKITDEVLGRMPRSKIEGVELSEAKPVSTLKISFADGYSWELELTKVELKTATAVVEALGAPVAAPAAPEAD